MKNIRIDPLGMLLAASAGSNTVTARVENVVVGVCPICNVSMQTLEVAEVQAYVCMEHCVCLPVEDTSANVPAQQPDANAWPAPTPVAAPRPYGYGLFSSTEKASKPPLTESEWWDSLSEAQQKKYIEMHPGSPHAK